MKRNEYEKRDGSITTRTSRCENDRVKIEENYGCQS